MREGKGREGKRREGEVRWSDLGIKDLACTGLCVLTSAKGYYTSYYAFDEDALGMLTVDQKKWSGLPANYELCIRRVSSKPIQTSMNKFA